MVIDLTGDTLIDVGIILNLTRLEAERYIFKYTENSIEVVEDYNLLRNRLRFHKQEKDYAIAFVKNQVDVCWVHLLLKKREIAHMFTPLLHKYIDWQSIRDLSLLLARKIVGVNTNWQAVEEFYSAVKEILSGNYFWQLCLLQAYYGYSCGKVFLPLHAQRSPCHVKISDLLRTINGMPLFDFESDLAVSQEERREFIDSYLKLLAGKRILLKIGPFEINSVPSKKWISIYAFGINVLVTYYSSISLYYNFPCLTLDLMIDYLNRYHLWSDLDGKILKALIR